MNSAGKHWWLSLTMYRIFPFQIVVYIADCVYRYYLTIYMNDIGISLSAIGTITALMPIAAFIFQPLFSSAGDKIHYKNTLLILVALGTAFMMLLLKQSVNVFYIGAVMCLAAAFFEAMHPLSEAMMLESLNSENLPFGPARLSGSAAFALSSWILGRIAENVGDFNNFPYIAALFFAGSAAMVLIMPKVEGHRKKGEKGNYKIVFENKMLMVIFAFTFLLYIINSLITSFLAIYLKDTLNYDSSFVGFALMVSSIGQFPFLFFSDKLYNRFGIGKLLLASTVLMFVRSLIIINNTNFVIICISQVFHCGFMILLFSIAKYIGAVMPPSHKAAGQMFGSVMVAGSAKIISSLLCGFLSEAFGIRLLFFIASAMSAATFFAFRGYVYRNNTELLKSSRGEPA